MKFTFKSIYIGSIGNSRLYIDIMLLPAFAAIYAAGGMGIVLLAIPAFLIHEAAHIIAAELFGCRVSAFTVMPTGGTLEMDNLDRTSTPQLCFIYSFAPLTNIMLYSLFYAIGIRSNSLVSLQFSLVNGFIAIFSFLPIYPLDGGNILKTLLCVKFDERRVIKILYSLNIAFSSSLILVFIYSFIKFDQVLWQPVVAAVLFIYSIIKYKNASTSNSISAIINKDSLLFHRKTLPSKELYILQTESISSAIKSASHDSLNTFIIVDEKLNILGRITEDALIAAAMEHGTGASLSVLL